MTLAKRFFCSPATITRILHRHQVVRTHGESMALRFKKGRFEQTKKWLDATLRKGHGWNKGIPNSNETRARISKARKGHNTVPYPLTLEEEEKVCELYPQGKRAVDLAHMFSCSCSTIKRVLKAQGIKRSENELLRISVSKMKRINGSPDLTRKRLRALVKRPTKPERKILNIIRKHNLPFTYTGDGKVVIGTLCPDFVATDGSKRVIEVFGTYWHNSFERNVAYHRTEEGRKEAFAKMGFKTTVIWEDEVKNEELVLNKIREERRRARQTAIALKV